MAALFSLSPSPAQAAPPTFVAKATATIVGANDLAVNVPVNTAENDLMLALVNFNGGAASTPTAPNGWTLIRQDTDESLTPAFSQAIYYRGPSDSEPASYTWTFNNVDAAIGGIATYRGEDPNNPIAAHSGQVNAASLSITALSITTTEDDTIVVGLFGYTDNSALTGPGSMTGRERFDLDENGGADIAAELADFVQATAGATGTQTATANGANGLDANIGQLVTLTPGFPIITATTANGTYLPGALITITVTFVVDATVTGTPTLTLETGATDATATYSDGSGSPTLTFVYVVQSGKNSADLDYTATNALSGTIKDSGMNDLDRTPALPGASRSLGANKALVIDSGDPTGQSVSSTTSDGNHAPQTNIDITIAFSEAVTVDTAGGTPSLTRDRRYRSQRHLPFRLRIGHAHLPLHRAGGGREPRPRLRVDRSAHTQQRDHPRRQLQRRRPHLARFRRRRLPRHERRAGPGPHRHPARSRRFQRRRRPDPVGSASAGDEIAIIGRCRERDNWLLVWFAANDDNIHQAWLNFNLQNLQSPALLGSHEANQPARAAAPIRSTSLCP